MHLIRLLFCGLTKPARDLNSRVTRKPRASTQKKPPPHVPHVRGFWKIKRGGGRQKKAWSRQKEQRVSKENDGVRSMKKRGVVAKKTDCIQLKHGGGAVSFPETSSKNSNKSKLPRDLGSFFRVTVSSIISLNYIESKIKTNFSYSALAMQGRKKHPPHVRVFFSALKAHKNLSVLAHCGIQGKKRLKGYAAFERFWRFLPPPILGGSKNFFLCKFSKNKTENDFNLPQTTFSGFSTFNTGNVPF